MSASAAIAYPLEIHSVHVAPFSHVSHFTRHGLRPSRHFSTSSNERNQRWDSWINWVKQQKSARHTGSDQAGPGGDFLSQLAGKAGVSPDAASAQLSSLLPEVIDKVTSNGKIEAGGIDQLFKMILWKMGA